MASTAVYTALLFGQLSRGDTNRKFSKLKIFNDLASAPIFSPSWGLTKIKWIFLEIDRKIRIKLY